MTKIRTRGETIRHFILNNVEKHAADIAKVTAEKFDITRQAVSKHLTKLVDECALIRKGNTRNKTYTLHPFEEIDKTFKLSQGLAEDLVWRQEILPLLGRMPENVLDIWHYGFTEMFNNIIDHSRGTIAGIRFSKTAINTQLVLFDNGVGIFKKIQQELRLLDERHAILELAKGKLTTDPENHTGEGIFFTSRILCRRDDQFYYKNGSNL